MNDGDKAAETRKGLFDTVKGKAKEMAGAVTGNDSLVTEGRLEQKQAKKRREAVGAEAEAEAEARAAQEAAQEAKVEAAKQRLEATVETGAAEQTIREQQAAQRQAVEAAGHRAAVAEQAQVAQQTEEDIARARAVERTHFESAAKEYTEGIDEHRKLTDAADEAEAKAERLRERAKQTEAEGK